MLKRSVLPALGALLLVMLSLVSQPAIPAGVAQAVPQPTPGPSADCRLFPETGKEVCGRFLTYWNEHGGLAQQGYPISGTFNEVSEVDGKTYQVQYFERAVFELHPDKQPPFDVLLSLLGSKHYAQRYPNGAPNQQPNNTAGSVLFPETGKRLGGIFLDYWNSHGGLMQQGYPITDEFQEKSELDGKSYTVQYFERAVFELHPEKQPPYNVLLSQLGTFQFNRKYGGQQGHTLQMGTWGTEHLAITVAADNIHLEYDCAHGSMDLPVVLDANGHFQVTGTHTFEHGGPSNEGPEDTHPATYSGTVVGNTMTLTVTVTMPGAAPQVLGPFTLVLGKQPLIHKCL